MAITCYHPEWGAERPICGVLFDMDGLVLDTEKLYSRFWREACAFYGFSMSYAQSLQMRGLGGPAGEAMIHRFFGPGADYMTLRRKRIQRMDAYLKEVGPEPKPGIYDLLDFLESQGIPAAITSSSPRERIAAYLMPLGLYHRFAKICSGHEVPRGKPAPDIYLHGAAQLGVDPRNCLALEDAPAGIRSAHAAGCLSVLIPDLDDPSSQLHDLLYAKADSLTEIPSLLGRL